MPCVRREYSATSQSLKVYNELLDTARANLEDRLEGTDAKLQLIYEGHPPETEPLNFEMSLIREERLSMLKSLAICASLFQHIRQIQPSFNRASDPLDQRDSKRVSEAIACEG